MFKAKVGDDKSRGVFVSRITIANLKYMFSFRRYIFNEAAFFRLKSFTNPFL